MNYNTGMSDPGTRIGGERHDFTQTAWSLILDGKQASPEQRAARFERLARRYWKPVYFYVRTRWGKSNEDAKDLTQQFFVWMLETDFLSKVQAGRGRFRNFVKVCLERFLSGRTDSERALRRGGGAKAVDFDFIQAVQRAPTAAAPEEVLDREWKRALVEEALARLQADCAAAGQDVRYAVFTEFYFAPAPGPDYEALAARHGLSRVDVGNHLARARARFRAFLEDQIAEGVSSPEDLRREFDDLFGQA